jgi:glycosyl transferase, family 25
MRIFVINLLRRPDRLEEIKRELQVHKLSFEVIEAVDAQSNPRAIKFHRPIFEIIFGKRLYGIGPTSNYLSHRHIWQKMLAENIAQALILEDDAKIYLWDKRILNIDITKLGLDVLRLGANVAPTGLTSFKTNYGHTEVLGRNLVAGQLWGNVANIVTLMAAKKFLVHKKYWFPSDDYERFNYCFGINYAIVNPLVWQASSSVSDVELKKKKLSVPQSISLALIKPLRRWVLMPAIQLYLRFKTSLS